MRKLALIGTAAVFLVATGYLLDTDPPYDSLWTTATELIYLIVIVFAFLCLLYYGVRALFRHGSVLP